MGIPYLLGSLPKVLSSWIFPSTLWIISWEFDRHGQLTIEDDVVKVCYQYSLENITKQLKDGTIQTEQQLWLVTHTEDKECPYEIEKIKIVLDEPFIIEVEDDNLKNELKKSDDRLGQESFDVASSIIMIRDTINSLYRFKFNENLLEIDEEKSLLELFRSATNKEEFSYRITALGSLAANMNVPSLRERTGIVDKQVKSIKLLESFLNLNQDKNDNTNKEELVDVIRNLYNMRHGYPVHSDKIRIVIESYKFFEIDYSNPNYKSDYLRLKSEYDKALRKLLEHVKKIAFEEED